MPTNNTTVSRNGLLDKRHYQAGFDLQLDDHVITVTRHKQVWQRYGSRTDPKYIFEEIDHEIEMAKAVTFEQETLDAREMRRTAREEMNRR